MTYPPHQNIPSSAGFTKPIELKCILEPGQEMKRILPLAIFTFFFYGLVVAVIAGIVTGSGVAGYALGAVGGAIITALMYARTKARITRTYGEQQRLVVGPSGLTRYDGTISIEMPLSAITRFEVRNSALSSGGVNVGTTGVAGIAANAAISASSHKVAAGIVGRATLTPLAGANRAQLRAHDRNSGWQSHLTKGQSYVAEQALIFPAEFEDNWSNGTVGAWIRHYRPDLVLPA